MHELAVTESVVDAVTERLPDTPISVVTLEIGKLSCVNADSLRFCFELCTPGTSLEGSRLELLEVPGRAQCKVCDAVTEVADLALICRCGSFELEILTGEELQIKSVEVA
jgi:hydrogenase nickel incorporation protein HypA/HybF